MLRDEYFNRLKQLIDHIEETQSDVMQQAAAIIADAMADGRCVHIYDTGHMLSSELINRAGGLTSFRALHFRFEVDDAVRNRPEDGKKDGNMEGLMRYVVKSSKLQPGDVLIVGTVSGKSVFPVDLAISARELGVKVIAMTSVAYSSMLASEHSSGKRLFEVADLVIDNCAPPLDALVEVPGQDVSICPASGIAAAAIMWAVEAQVVDNLLQRNLKPSILKSINFPGSSAYNEQAYQAYERTGY